MRKLNILSGEMKRLRIWKHLRQRGGGSTSSVTAGPRWEEVIYTVLLDHKRGELMLTMSEDADQARARADALCEYLGIMGQDESGEPARQ